MIPKQAVETVAKFMSETATDWTDIEINDHEHDLECTNWEAYTDDAQAALEAALPLIRAQIAEEEQQAFSQAARRRSAEVVSAQLAEEGNTK